MATSKHLADSKVTTENVSYAKKEMETQYEKYGSFISFLNVFELLKFVQR